MLSKINQAMANHAYNNMHKLTKKKPVSIQLLCYCWTIELIAKIVLGFFWFAFAVTLC
jgi:hypothetical protein